MPIPDTRKATPRAILRCVPGVDLSDYSFSLNLVADHIEDHAAGPNREPSIPGFATMLSLLKIQIFEHKNTVLGSPFDQLLRNAIAEVLGSTRSLSSKPFEGSNNASSIFTLCLSKSLLSLKSLDRLRSALVLDSAIQAAYEKLVSVCIDSHNSIGFIEIDTDGVNPLNIGKFNSVSNIANKLVSKILDYDTIDLGGVVEIFFECLWNFIHKMLPAIDCGNAQETISCEAGITPPLSDEEKGKRSMPIERMIQVMPVFLGSSISSSGEPDARASKLAGNRSFDIVIDSAMQIKSFKRFAEVPSSLRNTIA